jgi:hypothetical protein
MSLRNWIVFVVISVTSLTGAGVWAHAQAPVTPAPQAQPSNIISGSDFGFRVDGRKGNTPVGALVVRINGQWVEVQFSAGTKPLDLTR